LRDDVLFRSDMRIRKFAAMYMKHVTRTNNIHRQKHIPAFDVQWRIKKGRTRNPRGAYSVPLRCSASRGARQKWRSLFRETLIL